MDIELRRAQLNSLIDRYTRYSPALAQSLGEFVFEREGIDFIAIDELTPFIINVDYENYDKLYELLSVPALSKEDNDLIVRNIVEVAMSMYLDSYGELLVTDYLHDKDDFVDYYRENLEDIIANNFRELIRRNPHLSNHITDKHMNIDIYIDVLYELTAYGSEWSDFTIYVGWLGPSNIMVLMGV